MPFAPSNPLMFLRNLRRIRECHFSRDSEKSYTALEQLRVVSEDEERMGAHPNFVDQTTNKHSEDGEEEEEDSGSVATFYFLFCTTRKRQKSYY